MKQYVLPFLKKSWMFFANILVTLVLVIIFTPSQGLAGSDGLIGSSGAPGSSGVSGSQGEIGSPGEPGIEGPSGPPGEEGVPGTSGSDGDTPYIADNGNWWIGQTDTGVFAGYSTAEIEANVTSLDLLVAQQQYRATSLIHPAIVSTPEYIRNLVDNEGYTTISTVFELLSIADGNGKYVFTNDIDFNDGTIWDQIPVFSGILDGAGFAIKNLDDMNLNAFDLGPALFGELDGAVIKNLTIQDAMIASFGFVSVLSTNAYDSTFMNLQFNDNSVLGNDSAALIANQMFNSVVYDVVFTGNRVMTRYFGSLIANRMELSTIMAVTIDDSELVIGNNHGGFLASQAIDSIFDRIVFSNSYVSVVSLIVDDTVDVYSIALGVGDGSKLVFSDLEFIGSTITVFERLILSNMYIVDIGGVIGTGEGIFIIDVTINQGFDTIIPYIRVENQGELSYVEYIGGVAGSLTDYVLINITNHGSVLTATNFFGVTTLHKENAGILGYSSGIGYLYNVANYGLVSSGIDIGGIIGGVGDVQGPYVSSLGSITMHKVANYGLVYGLEQIGGMMGSVTESTSLLIKDSLSAGMVFGVVAVGGMIGVVVPSPATTLVIEDSIIISEVRGFAYVGGMIGVIADVNDQYGHIRFSNIISQARVQSLELGRIAYDDVAIGFSPHTEIGLETNRHIGVFIGLLLRPVELFQVFVHTLTVQQQVFIFENSQDFIEDTFVTGFYQPVGNRLLGGLFLRLDQQPWWNDLPIRSLFNPRIWSFEGDAIRLIGQSNMLQVPLTEEILEILYSELYYQKIIVYSGDPL